MKIMLPECGLTIEAKPGSRLYDALRQAGVIFDAPCGGNGTCFKCKVKVKPAGECAVSKKRLSKADYEDGFRLACYYKPIGDIVISIQEGGGTNSNSVCRPLGQIVALDIGTTTIALEAYDDKGKTVHSAYFVNPQKVYGADVISRINACKEDLKNITSLRGLLLDSLKPHTCGAKKVVVAANTAMLHIFAGIDPTPIGVAPYKAVFTERREITHNQCVFELLPSAGAFIGADITAGIISSGMYHDAGNVLLVDLGTNGEIVLKSKEKYYGASAAAGPAFEGGNISCGSYASGTAVASAVLKGKNILLDKPESNSICGAGLIDLVACLLQRGDIEESGAIKDGSDNITVGGIVLTNKDIREVQLAKAAINATIQMLIKAAGLTIDDLDKVYLAGGLGQGLNPKSAERIGLLPKGLASKTVAVGNSSLKGAAMCAKDGSLLEVADKTASSIKIIELTQNAEFFNLYIEAMFFE